VNLITSIMDDLQAKIASIEAFEKKTIKFIEPDVLTKEFTGLALPACALGYEGMRSVDVAPGAVKVTHRVGLSAAATFGIYVIFQNIQMITLKQTYTDITVNTMDSIRNVIKDTKSPVGHYYEFVMESPYILRGHTVWVQRWKTPVPKV
jgi:hypothetical protein